MRNESTSVNEFEVELCMELARQFNEEDLTAPPHRQLTKDKTEEEGE